VLDVISSCPVTCSFRDSKHPPRPLRNMADILDLDIHQDEAMAIDEADNSECSVISNYSYLYHIITYINNIKFFSIEILIFDSQMPDL